MVSAIVFTIASASLSPCASTELASIGAGRCSKSSFPISSRVFAGERGDSVVPRLCKAVTQAGVIPGNQHCGVLKMRGDFDKHKLQAVGHRKTRRFNGPLATIDLDSRRPQVLHAIREGLSNCLTETSLSDTVPGLGPKIQGKVRDTYDAGEYLVLVTTDRQSAFDRVLASVPFKGQVLNETSVWWFDKTRHITSNALVAAPDPNVTIAKKCSVFPVEFVVRGYVTGSTSTSLWTVYKEGVRNYCGNPLSNGMQKNQRLEENILTPTTKAVDHDYPISGDEIVEQGLMSKEDFEEVRSKALALFAYGQELALQHGLLLVDTKYEFGKASDGSILLIDEVHTPDSSRYWVAASYEERHSKGLEPDSIDKEFLRLWFKNNCNPYQDKVLPTAPEELVAELAWRYIVLYEGITGTKIRLPDSKEPLHDRISRNVQQALKHLG